MSLLDGGGDTKMAINYDLKKNQSGYSDPTAYKAIIQADKDVDKLNKLIHSIRDICDLAGFEIEERIILKDKKTGKIWR